MKKIFLLLGLMLTIASSVSAFTVEELVGKWESNPIKETDPASGMTITERTIYDFKDDMTVAQNGDVTMVIQLDQALYVDVFMEFKASGTYSVAGDSIMIHTPKETISVTFTEDDIRVRGMEDEAIAAQIQEGMFANMSQMKGQLIEQPTEDEVFNNVMIIKNKMTCTREDKIITFKRKKK